ncbi:MAG: transporter substrate-binding domain-containing protein [Candidatus Hodarchaeota archaeon]
MPRNTYSNKIVGIAVVALFCAAATNTGFILFKIYFENVPEYDVGLSIANRGYIKLGTAPDYPPFESLVDTGDGLEVVGFDVDLAKWIAANLSEYYTALRGRPMKIELRIEAAFFNALITGLTTQAYDIVIAAFAIRDYREAQVDFSVPYFRSQQCCIVWFDEMNITDVTDLNGTRVAVQTGSTAEEQSPAWNASEIKSYPSVNHMILSLTTDDVDAVVLDYPVAEYFASLNSDLKIAFNFTDPEKIEYFGVAMDEEMADSDVMGVINSTLIWLNASGKLKIGELGSPPGY